MNYRSKTCLVIDNGLFCELAVTLSKSFGKVFYWSPWITAFPKSNQTLIGKGVPGITRIDDFWGILDEIDLFVFPDVYYGPLQLHLIKLGKRVWGGRMGDDLELYRDAAKQHMQSLGMDVGPYAVVTGLDALRAHLKRHDNQFVKISKTRGDMETFHAKNYKLIEPRLDDLEHSLGAKKKIMQFVVEEAIDNAVECGYDGWCIDGEFPRGAMTGIEVKDKGYIIKTTTYDKLSDPVRAVNDGLASTLRGYNYRGFISTEVRATKDGKAYLIDACQRAGSPPNEIYQILVENWPDILWEGAEGNIVEPKFAAKWGAELLLISDWANKNWQAVEFPAKFRENIKLRNMTMIDGRWYVIPQYDGCPEIGAVVAVGDSMDDAIQNTRKIAESVEGHYIEVVPDALDEAKGEIEKLKTFGIEL